MMGINIIRIHHPVRPILCKRRTPTARDGNSVAKDTSAFTGPESPAPMLRSIMVKTMPKMIDYTNHHQNCGRVERVLKST